MTWDEALDGARAEVKVRIEHLDEMLFGLRVDRGAEDADDEHDPEGGTLSVEWSRLAGLRAEAQRESDEIEAAFVRLSAGSYGICVDCGESIAEARLAARPTAVRCIACARESAI